MSERMPLFLTGWRYVSTQEEADALPQGSVAIVDDAFLWDCSDLKDPDSAPTLGHASWDGVVNVQQRDMIHRCHEFTTCNLDGCRFEWFETGDTRGYLTPDLPFFAWHPTFCTP